MCENARNRPRVALGLVDANLDLIDQFARFRSLKAERHAIVTLTGST
jgi:hypothetical protein